MVTIEIIDRTKGTFKYYEGIKKVNVPEEKLSDNIKAKLPYYKEMLKKLKVSKIRIKK